jgi:hypothetical protein
LLVLVIYSLVVIVVVVVVVVIVGSHCDFVSVIKKKKKKTPRFFQAGQKVCFWQAFLAQRLLKWSYIRGNLNVVRVKF